MREGFGRIAWFIGLWMGSVLGLGIVAYSIRLILKG